MEPIEVETLRTWLEEGRPVTILDVRPAEQRAFRCLPCPLGVIATVTFLSGMIAQGVMAETLSRQPLASAPTG